MMTACQQVLKSDPAVQKTIAPFLQYPALRGILRSFTQGSEFGNWADNPQVISMLREALRLLRNGHITEQQLEHALLSQLQVSVMAAVMLCSFMDASHDSIGGCCTLQTYSEVLYMSAILDGVRLIKTALCRQTQTNSHLKSVSPIATEGMHASLQVAILNHHVGLLPVPHRNVLIGLLWTSIILQQKAELVDCCIS